ncbi:MAG: extracellular solute-binding protein [Tepidisphaeraceae bacterium]
MLLLTFAVCHLPFSISSALAADVVLYTSVDHPYAAPIVREFEKKSGLKVAIVTDAEATKSVGLAERVRAEKDNPQCDVFWSNEPFHTINLAAEGLLQPYQSPSAKDVPERFKDPEHKWAGNALRARVIAMSPYSSFIPSGIDDLAKPEWKGKIVMARPTAGTTGGHVAAIYVLLGDEKATKFFRDLRANEIKLVGGNSVVAEQVGRAKFFFGLTDNDDITAAQANKVMTSQVLPDQGEEGHGTLMVPTTVGLVAGAPHAAAAKKLIDYLLSSEVEKTLIDAKFALLAVRELDKSKVRAMKVDYRAVAKAMPQAVRKATAILEGRE